MNKKISTVAMKNLHKISSPKIHTNEIKYYNTHIDILKYPLIEKKINVPRINTTLLKNNKYKHNLLIYQKDIKHRFTKDALNCDLPIMKKTYYTLLNKIKETEKDNNNELNNIITFKEKLSKYDYSKININLKTLKHEKTTIMIEKLLRNKNKKRRFYSSKN